MKPIIGLVGPSNSGKSTLIIELVRRFPNELAILRSLTTRARRSAEDDLFYRFVALEEIQRLDAEGNLIQVTPYIPGSTYANVRTEADATLENRIGVMALIEQGVTNFRNAGYVVIAITVTPEGNGGNRDETRRIADERRAQEILLTDLNVTNSFLPGGKERTLDEITAFLRRRNLLP